MGDLCMPSLGADMEAGTLVEWLVPLGASVKRGDVVALVETQKGIVEIEIWESGVITELLVQPGTKVPVGTVLAKIGSEMKPKANGGSAHVTVIETHEPKMQGGELMPRAIVLDAPPSAPAKGPTVVRASPAARQLARDLGVDLESVHGTGPHGAVTRDDVAHARAVPPKEEPAPVVAPPAKRGAINAEAMRRAIGAAMARSKREIPHYYLTLDLDMGLAIAWLTSENAARPVTERILPAALLLKATARAIHDVPEMNGFYGEGTFRPSKAIHLGVGISLRGGGLIAPALHDVDQKPLVTIMAELADLVGRARAGTLRSSEMSDPTITVTNLGDQGADSVLGVIYPPQVALVGFGTMRERPWAENGMLGVRPIIAASLAADHRVSDGHRGARFLGSIARLLKTPESL